MAVATPKLPKGWIAQMAAHRDIGDVCYEFRRVYDEKSKLHEDKSYWLLTPIGDSGDVNAGTRATQSVSFQQYQDANGPLNYEKFSSPTVPVAELADWVAGRVVVAAA